MVITQIITPQLYSLLFADHVLASTAGTTANTMTGSSPSHDNQVVTISPPAVNDSAPIPKSQASNSGIHTVPGGYNSVPGRSINSPRVMEHPRVQHYRQPPPAHVHNFGHAMRSTHMCHPNDSMRSTHMCHHGDNQGACSQQHCHPVGIYKYNIRQKTICVSGYPDRPCSNHNFFNFSKFIFCG